MIGIKIQKHFCYITSNNPQFAYAPHILHIAHKYGTVEETNLNYITHTRANK